MKLTPQACDLFTSLGLGFLPSCFMAQDFSSPWLFFFAFATATYPKFWCFLNPSLPIPFHPLKTNLLRLALGIFTTTICLHYHQSLLGMSWLMLIVINNWYYASKYVSIDSDELAEELNLKKL